MDLINELGKMQAVPYKGGIKYVAYKAKPKYQCTCCYKPWWPQDLMVVFDQSCPNCFGKLRRITKDDPLIVE